MPRPTALLLLGLALCGGSGAEPARAEPAIVVYGQGGSAPAFTPRRRVQDPGAEATAAAVIVVRGKRAEVEAAGALATGPDLALLAALADLCRLDPRRGETVALGLPGPQALPARF
jgi:hypothetical protein